MRSSIGFLLAVALVSSGSAKERAVRQLAPSTQWVVDYANDSCSLGRGFGVGDQKVTLFFDQYEPGDTFNLTFVGKPVYVEMGSPKATIQFGPNEIPADETAVSATTKNTPAIILQGNQRLGPLTDAEKAARKRIGEGEPPVALPPIGPAREKAATWLRLGKVLPFDLLLETGPMDAPLAALRECSWDMVKSWGLDVEQQKHLSRKTFPTQPSSDWFSDNDYPAGMLREGAQAIVNFRLLIDETGRVSSCKIQTSTRPKQFDDVVCGIVMKKAKFHPALDAGGKQVPSFWRQTVSFRIAM